MSKLGRPFSQSLLASPRNDASDKMAIDDDLVDTGTIRCICNSSDDDGFTIQCERCFVWQHAFCVDIRQNNIPEHYLCDKCSKLYPELRRSMDLQNRKNSLPFTPDDQGSHDAPRSEKKRLQTTSDSVMQRRKAEKSKNKFGLPKRSRELLSAEAYQPHTSRTADKKPKLSKRISIPKQTLKDLESDEDMFSRIKRRKSTADDSSPAAKSTVKCKFVKQIFRDARDRWKQPSSRCVTMDATALRPSVPKIAVYPLSKVKEESLAITKSHRSTRKGVFAQMYIPSNQFLAEVIGDVVLKSGYKFDATNNYVILGTAKARVLFYPEMDLCIDARRFGNEVRHIRRSCHPSAELRNVVLPQSKDMNTVRLGVFTRDNIQKGQEITLGWSWQKGHISWKKNMDWHNRGGSMDDRHQVIDEEEERKNRRAIRNMLDALNDEFGSCACKDRSSCLIEYLKRESAKGSLMSEVTRDRHHQNRKVVDGSGDSTETKRSRSTTTSPQHGQPTSETIPLTENSNQDVTLQHSRQIIVAKNNNTLESPLSMPPTTVEDSIDIDVISTSPRIAHSVVPSSEPGKVAPSDGEEELDVDGEIDVGEELPSLRPAEPENDDSDDLSSDSSLSSTGSVDIDSDRNRAARRRFKRESSPSVGRKRTIKQKSPQISPKLPTDDDAEQRTDEAKECVLPLKKFWMRKCIQNDTPIHKSKESTPPPIEPIKEEKPIMDTVTAEPAIPISELKSAGPTTTQHDAAAPLDLGKNLIVEKEDNVDNAETVAPIEETIQEENPKSTPAPTTHSDDMDVDDGELSDASSASTLPLEEEDRHP